MVLICTTLVREVKTPIVVLFIYPEGLEKGTSVVFVVGRILAFILLSSLVRTEARLLSQRSRTLSVQAAKTQTESPCFWPEQPEEEAQECVRVVGGHPGEKMAAEEDSSFSV